MKKRMMKRAAAAAMTGVMAVSMSSVAFAAEMGNITGGTYTKNVLTDGNTYAPNETFTFNVTSPTVTEGTKWGDYLVRQDTGSTPALSFDSVSFSDADGIGETISKPQDAVPKYKFDDALLQDLTPGVYRYEVAEQAGTYEGMTYDDTVYVAYVYVLRNDSTNRNYVGAIEFIKKSDESNVSKKSQEIVFNNNYGGKDHEDEITSLKVKKEIEGNQAEKDDTFTVSIKVTDEDASGEKYRVVKYGADGNTIALPEGEDNLISGTPGSYTLTDDEYIMVYGLSENDEYTVKEVQANEDGYTTKYFSDEAKGTGTEMEVNKDGEVGGKANKSDKVVIIENRREATTPTGIVTTFAPYVLMLGAAGAAGGMFLRKKKEDF